jgi:antitoxin HigA-1
MTYERKRSAGWAVHPGIILKLEFLKPLELSGYRLAKGIDVTPQSVNDIILRKKGISAAMAIRLSKFFGTTEEFWMNLQAAYDLRTAKKGMNRSLKRITPLTAA